MLLNEHRRRFVDHYRARLLAPGGLRKAFNPGSIYRTLKTFTTNKNLRTVGAEELLGDAEASVHALARLSRPATDTTLAEWLPLPRNDADTEALGELFREHGSDKSTSHDYFEVYGSILRGKRSAPLRILEIGLGTNNLTIQSNMGLGGRPGASLRAFRDWASNATVVGADIDRGILFEEEHITTYWVDQTSPESLSALAGQVGNGYDLIIDDGLHLPHSNFNTLEALLPLLADSGTFVVEDIDPIHLHYWHIAEKALADYDTFLSERRGGYIFIVRKRS